ncbi:MAG TPA: prolipoprotein diacylglyceryl transferase [Solibacterales bacterium]|nr:prolipoprotein diacylglyceryl transferase [Bryobacterales bacterium]
MHPKIIEIGGFFLPTYGLLVAIGFLTGLWITSRLARREGLNADAVTNLAVYCALAGIAGAKLLMFLWDIDYFTSRPSELFSLNTLQAGGVFYGGLIAAIAVSIWYVRREKLPGLATADPFAPGIALGHAIGRVGCFAAGCCWGARCERPWAVTFTSQDAHDRVGVPLNVPLHPSQLYEAAAELIIFGILFTLARRPHGAGHIIGLYLALYGSTRFLVEFVREHGQALIWGLSNSQWISLALACAGLWLRFRRRSVPATA